eukprot:scaffold9796_cov36-Cyclotella_meneghiniana.AAC.1
MTSVVSVIVVFVSLLFVIVSKAAEQFGALQKFCLSKTKLWRQYLKILLVATHALPTIIRCRR